MRERYVGPWLPEPLVEASVEPPEAALEAVADISTAFLLMLERLGPEERAVFLLHQVFDFDYGDVAATVGKTEAACTDWPAARKDAAPCRIGHNAAPCRSLKISQNRRRSRCVR